MTLVLYLIQFNGNGNGKGEGNSLFMSFSSFFFILIFANLFWPYFFRGFIPHSIYTLDTCGSEFVCMYIRVLYICMRCIPLAVVVMMTNTPYNNIWFVFRLNQKVRSLTSSCAFSCALHIDAFSSWFSSSYLCELSIISLKKEEEKTTQHNLSSALTICISIVTFKLSNQSKWCSAREWFHRIFMFIVQFQFLISFTRLSDDSWF